MSDPIRIGPNFPRRRSAFLKGFASGIFRITGWSVTGELPDTKKLVIVAAPHTSNWDFVFGLLASFYLELRVHWVGKHTIFVGPFGYILRRFGGIPVHRESPGTVIQDILKGYSSHEQFVMGVSPEGTRSKVKRWKQGFHVIARRAGVPVLAAGIDFNKKVIHMGPLFEMTDDVHSDIALLKRQFEGYQPRHPELY